MLFNSFELHFWQSKKELLLLLPLRFELYFSSSSTSKGIFVMSLRPTAHTHISSLLLHSVLFHYLPTTFFDMMIFSHINTVCIMSAAPNDDEAGMAHIIACQWHLFLYSSSKAAQNYGPHSNAPQ